MICPITRHPCRLESCHLFPCPRQVWPIWQLVLVAGALLSIIVISALVAEHWYAINGGQ